MNPANYRPKDPLYVSYTAELRAMIGKTVKLCEAMTRLGWPSETAIVESVSPAETFPLLIRWPSGRCLKVTRHNLEAE